MPQHAQLSYTRPNYGTAPPAPIGNDAALATTADADAPVQVAHAKRLGKGFQVILSAENLFGYVHQWGTTSYPRTQINDDLKREISYSQDTVAFLGNGTTASIAPGLGVDFVVGPGVTVGGAFYYASVGGETTELLTDANSTTSESTWNNAREVHFGINVRAGYVVMFTDVVGIWPRLGFSYQNTTYTRTRYTSGSTGGAPLEFEAETQLDSLAIKPDFNLVLSPAPHFALLLGLSGRLGFGGRLSGKTANVIDAEADVRDHSLGLTAGLVGYL